MDDINWWISGTQMITVWFQVARKLAMVEADLERAEERAEAGEKWVWKYIADSLRFTVVCNRAPMNQIRYFWIFCWIALAGYTVPPLPDPKSFLIFFHAS